MFLEFIEIRPLNTIDHDGLHIHVDDKIPDGNGDSEDSTEFENSIRMDSFERKITSQKQYCSDLSRVIDLPPPLVTVSIADIYGHRLEAYQRVHNGSQIFDRGVNYDTKYDYLSNTSNTMTLQKLDNIGSGRDSYSYTLYALKSSENTNDIISGSLESSRQWEADDIRKIITSMDQFASSNNLSRSEVYFIDIGANVGTFSFAAAAAGFMVISFEAMRVNQRALQLSLCSNPKFLDKIAIFNIALGKQEANCAIYSVPGNVLDGTVGCGTKPPLPGMIFRQTLNISSLDMVLDDIIPTITGKVAALKMDTEGFEPWVIEGGREFFSKVHPPFFTTELNSIALRSGSGYSSMDFIKQILGLGYDLRHLNFDGPLFTEDKLEQELASGDEALMNLYFTKKNANSNP